MKKFLLILFTAILLLFGTAHATAILVTNLNDSGSGSLRDVASRVGPNDTIIFMVSGTITLSSPITFTNTTQYITASSGHIITINGNNVTRCFLHTGTGTLNLNYIYFSNCKNTVTNTGSAISSNGVIYMSNGAVSNNHLVYNVPGATVYGGAIYSVGSFTSSNVSFGNNNFTTPPGGYGYGNTIYSVSGPITIGGMIPGDPHIYN